MADQDSSEKKIGFLKRAWGKVKGAAPSTEEVKGAAVKGAVAGGALVGGGIAAGAGLYYGGKSLWGGGWRLSKRLFGAINLLFLFSIILHTYDIVVINNQGTGALYASQSRPMMLLLFALLMWVFVYNNRGGGMSDLRAFFPPLVISAIVMILPALFFNPLTLKLTGMQTTLSYIFILVPIWPICIMFGAFGIPSTPVLRFIRVVYIGLLILYFLPTTWYSISQDFNITSMRVGLFGVIYNMERGTIDGLKQLYTGAKDMVFSIPGALKKATEKQIQYAVGDYYTGQVEEGKNKPIGVYLENVEPAATEFYADDKVVVWATLIARTLDPGKEITVTASCYGEKSVGDELKKEKGDADPSTTSDVYIMKTMAEEEKYITCEFPPNFFDKGPKSIFVNAEFNFETMSYIKTYFMNLETLRATKHSGIDPLDQYKITDKEPKSVCTNGPISLNIKTSDVPIGVSATEPVDIKLGITLENVWQQGRIKKVDSLVIKIPKPMEITYCDHAFEKTACSDAECEDGKYTSVYRIKKGKEGGRMGLDNIKNVQGYHSIACRLKVNDINGLMGNYPLVTDYFKATADYVYELEKNTAVNIKEALSNKTPAPTKPQQAKAPVFSYRPTSSSVTVKIGQQKEFSVTITNPGKISYGWQSQGVREEVMPDVTSYIFSSDKAGGATVTFKAVDPQGKEVEKKTWNVEVAEATT